MLSETVASALEFLDNDDTLETRTFIRIFDRFFDIMNIKSALQGKFKRKDIMEPFHKEDDFRFKVRNVIILCTIFIDYYYRIG